MQFKTDSRFGENPRALSIRFALPYVSSNFRNGGELTHTNACTEVRYKRASVSCARGISLSK